MPSRWRCSSASGSSPSRCSSDCRGSIGRRRLCSRRSRSRSRFGSRSAARRRPRRRRRNLVRASPLAGGRGPAGTIAGAGDAQCRLPGAGRAGGVSQKLGVGTVVAPFSTTCGATWRRSQSSSSGEADPSVLTPVLSGRRRSASLRRMVAGFRSALLAAFRRAARPTFECSEPVPFRMPRNWTTIAQLARTGADVLACEKGLRRLLVAQRRRGHGSAGSPAIDQEGIHG